MMTTKTTTAMIPTTTTPMTTHDWGWIGAWGIIYGVHRCRQCGIVATPAQIAEECQPCAPVAAPATK